MKALEKKTIILLSPFILFKLQEEAALRESKFCFLSLNVSYMFFMWCFDFLSTRNSYKLSSDGIRENLYLADKYRS